MKGRGDLPGPLWGWSCCLRGDAEQDLAGAMLMAGIYGGNQVQRAVWWPSGDKPQSTQRDFFNNDRWKSWHWKGDYSFVLRPLLLITPHLWWEQRKALGLTPQLGWCHSMLPLVCEQAGDWWWRGARAEHSAGPAATWQEAGKRVWPRRDVIIRNEWQWHCLGMKRPVHQGRMGLSSKSSVSCWFRLAQEEAAFGLQQPQASGTSAGRGCAAPHRPVQLLLASHPFATWVSLLVFAK